MGIRRGMQEDRGGGSMIWFGSSAGVAISNAFPEVKDTRRWLAEGWHGPVAYVLGFFAMLALLGWGPRGAAGGPARAPPAWGRAYCPPPAGETNPPPRIVPWDSTRRSAGRIRYQGGEALSL